MSFKYQGHKCSRKIPANYLQHKYVPHKTYNTYFPKLFMYRNVMGSLIILEKKSTAPSP